MKESTPLERLIRRRLTDLYREVGTLLIAFAPLDYSLEPAAARWTLVGFVVVGIALFALSVIHEARAKT